MSVKARLAHQYIGFDLDDTLHYFKKASKAASAITLEACSRATGVDLVSLSSLYTQALLQTQSGHFIKDRSGREYRSDRFGFLLRQIERMTVPLLDQLLDLYEFSLTKFLEARSDALATMQTIKQSQKTIIVITEGPTDAQNRTLAHLGLSPFVDLVLTSSGAGCSKTNGLFEVALSRLGISGPELLYVGDNWDRDILPASQLGIEAIHLGDIYDTESRPIKIRELSELLSILEPRIFD